MRIFLKEKLMSIFKYNTFYIFLIVIASCFVVHANGECVTDCTEWVTSYGPERPYTEFSWDNKQRECIGRFILAERTCQPMKYCSVTDSCENDGPPYTDGPYRVGFQQVSCGPWTDSSIPPTMSFNGHVDAARSAVGSMSLDSEGNTNLVVSLSWPGSDLDLILYPPYGPKIQPSSNISSGIIYTKNTTYKQYQILNPLSGYWIFEVKPIVVGINGEDYTVSIYQFPNETPPPAKEDSHDKMFSERVLNSPTNKTILRDLYSDSGIDVNGDGNYEVLAINANITVSQPGHYTLLGDLYDSNGAKIVWSVGGGFFEVGNQTIALDFDGKTIRKHGINGPYYLKNLILQSGSSDVNMTLCDAAPHDYVTSEYNYLDFADQ